MQLSYSQIYLFAVYKAPVTVTETLNAASSDSANVAVIIAVVLGVLGGPDVLAFIIGLICCYRKITSK